MNLKQKFSILNSEEGTAIRCYNDSGPVFGGGCVILIFDKSNEVRTSYSRTKCGYYDIKHSNEEFGGSSDSICHFLVNEFEIYEVE